MQPDRDHRQHMVGSTERMGEAVGKSDNSAGAGMSRRGDGSQSLTPSLSTKWQI